jgi:cell division protein FtsN
MAKDYAKFVPKQRPFKKKSRGMEYFLIVLLVVVVFAAGGTFLFEKQFRGVNLLSFLHQKKETQLASKMAAKKMAMAESKQAPAVQFDFYNELPNMQMTVTEAPAGKGVPDNRPVKVTAQLAKIEAKKETPTAPVTTVTPATTTQAALITASEVSGLLDEENHAQHFVIHLGSFESETGARRLLEAIKSVGFAVEIVKTKQGPRTTFSVQQGPFDSISVARATQARMQKRGIVSVIRKTA